MPAPDTFVGKTVGNFRILGLLGAGGMGRVYRARDLRLDRDVALKMLPDAFARDAERLERFRREARILASLNHPNIAAIYGLEDSEEIEALVMELIEGPTLAEIIRSGPLPIDEALRVARQIADALEYAHERGVVHRDLKPANVKVAPEDTVKVLDFGLAKAVASDSAAIDSSSSPTITRMATQAGILLGTAGYMAPEQAKGKPVDRRADIWAFGCVLYEMLTGRMAYPGETTTEILAAVIRGEPDWLLLPVDTPLGARILLQRCLQKDPRQRLRDIGDARLSIDEMLSGALPALSGAPITVAVSGRIPLWRRTLPWACFAAALVAVAVLSWFLAGRRAAAPEAAMQFEIAAPAKASIATSGSFALSPNGRNLAFFAAGSDGVTRLWVRSMNSLDAHPLPGSESVRTAPIFWSPDSRFLAYGAGGELKKINVLGGSPVNLCTVPGGTVLGGSWNRDGVILFGSSNGIMRVSADGGTATQVTALDASRSESAHSMPDFLPDGRHFLYERRSVQSGLSGIYGGSLTLSPQHQEMRQVVESGTGAIYVPPPSGRQGQLLYLREGELVAQPFSTRKMELTGEAEPVASQVGSFLDFGYFSVADNGVLVYRSQKGAGVYQLAWFDSQGKLLQTVSQLGQYGPPSLSPDGSEAAVGNGSFLKRALWLLNFSKSTTTRFTFGPAGSTTAVWSPDGKQVVFSSDVNGVYDLYEKPASGASGAELLLKSDEDKYPSSFSPDGSFLLYATVDPRMKRDMWVLPIRGDHKPYPFLRTPANEWDGHISPDGRWVAYVSDESGRYEIYVRPFSPGASTSMVSDSGKWQVSYGGGEKPQWSRNGKFLYYMTPEDQVMAVPVATNPVFQAGEAKLLFQAPNQPEKGNPGNYTVDGSRFLLLSPEKQGGQAPFVVLLNWQSLLHK